MIRHAEENDLIQINDIYNQAVLSGFETGDTVPVTMIERRSWFVRHLPHTYPVFVHEVNNRVVGWLSFSPYRFGRGAFKYTAEISYYVDQSCRNQGIGRSLMEYAISQSKSLHFKTLIAILLEENSASIHLLKKFNFTEWGFLPGVADFEGKVCGHLYYGLKL